MREIQTDQMNQYNDGPVVRFTQGEIEHAIHAGGRKKAPGRDGLSSEFYKHIWEVTQVEMVEIFNQIFRDVLITARQKQGVIISLPKREAPTSLVTSDPSRYSTLTTRYWRA